MLNLREVRLALPWRTSWCVAGTPCTAGTETNGLYAFLGLLPPPVGEECDITELYMEKLEDWRKLKHKRYQVPLEGSRYSIRVLQQVNGWRNEVGSFQASALVPVNRDLRARELAALLERWPAAHRHQ